MTDDKIIAKLFNKLKDSFIYTTLSNGRVKIRGGATYGDWAEIGRIIDPSHHRPIELAEDFMYNHRKAAKELRTQIAQWRKDNAPPEVTSILAVEGDCFHEWEVIGECNADSILALFRNGRNDADDWDVTDDETIAGVRVVQIIDRIEGESRKFMWKE